MENKIKVENRKKLSLKNAIFCHITKNEIILQCKTINKKGIKTEWVEVCPNDIKIRLQSGKNFNASSFYFNNNLLGLIKDIDIIEFWPNNEGIDSNFNLQSIIVRTKKANISLNTYFIDGKKYGAYDACIVCNDKNELFL